MVIRRKDRGKPRWSNSAGALPSFWGVDPVRPRLMTTPDTRPATPRNSRRVSRRVQLVIVTGVVLTAGIVGVVTPLVLGSLADQPEHARSVTPAGARGIFAPTQQQWRDLGLQPVTIRAFRSERSTEGNIAIGDDLTTAVFSPYSGRV